MATAQKRGSTWTAIFERGRDASGKRLQGTKGGFRVKRAPAGTDPTEAAKLGALDFAQAQERAIGAGTYIEPARLTLSAFLERWLTDYAAPRVRQRTIEGYRGVIRRYVEPNLGGVELQRLTPAAIQAFYARLQGGWEHQGRPRAGVSARTVLHTHRVLKQALGWAVRWQLLARNPADAVAPPEARQHAPVVLTPEGVSRLMAAIQGTVIDIPVRLALATGLRRGELLALKWADVDLEAGFLSVNASVQVVVGQGLQVLPPKTARSRRRIALSRATVALLRQHRAAQMAERLRLGGLWHDEGWVFTGADGRVARPDLLTQRFAAAARVAGLPGLRFHDLRHGHASLLLLGGVHAKVVSERLGHATISVTLDVYSHVLGGMDAAAAEVFDDVLRRAALANG